tara:strand:- start:741 stop:1034 length:294 start_codon:yes stop_codon:yes gene_type:complete
MNKEHMIFCVFAFILGILVSDMYQNMCGCNSIVEGQTTPSPSTDTPSPNSLSTDIVPVLDMSGSPSPPASTRPPPNQYPLTCSGGIITLDLDNPITN